LRRTLSLPCVPSIPWFMPSASKAQTSPGTEPCELPRSTRKTRKEKSHLLEPLQRRCGSVKATLREALSLSVCSEYSVVHAVGQQSANLTGGGRPEHRDGARTRSRDGCATVGDRQIQRRRRQSQWFLRSRHRRLNCRRRGWCRFFHHSRSPCRNLKQHPLKHRPHSKHNRRLTQDRKSKQQFAS
jgi:hypothetical protein